jgi:hypothetical protein
MAAPDRLEALVAQDQVTAVDFVYVWPGQTQLDVFFLRDPLTLGPPAAPLDQVPQALTASQLRIVSPSGGETLPEVPVAAIAWAVHDGRNVLRITTTVPGDFSRYRLLIADPRIDPYPYRDAHGRRRDEFTFKANCPSELDCEAGPHECPSEPLVDVPVDYRARDFWSFRRALLDFTARRYPDWKDRLEADLGVMLAEMMSAVGDELAYIQDRIGRESHLETAAERRSLRRLARLVDYELDDGLGAVTWLDVTVDPVLQTGLIPAGTKVWEAGPQAWNAGRQEWEPAKRITFEFGRGLGDLGTGVTVDARRNELLPHLWDEDDVCLPVGSTSLHVQGHRAAVLAFDDPPSAPTGKWVLLQTRPAAAGVPARAIPVRLTMVDDQAGTLTDPVFNQPITRLAWEPLQATPVELDLETLVVRGNLVPATAGDTRHARFRIGPAQPGDPPEVVEAVERTGPNGSVAYLASLPGSDAIGVVWHAEAGGRRPEVRLHEATKVGPAWVTGQEWEWRRSFVGVNSSQPNDRHFVLDDGTWRPVVGYQRAGAEIVHVDYATGAGGTVRFGDGEFGQAPVANQTFQATYRLGNGRPGNVAARTLTVVAPGLLPFVTAVTNPLAAVDGEDPEDAERVRRRAPEAFRAVTFRAVRPEDYAEAAERLPWVQRAGAAFRWTGSWLTAFVTPDPRGAIGVSAPLRAELVAQLDRFRQAGREAYPLDPVYANLDLEITVCVEPGVFTGEVKARILEALFGTRGLRPRPGFFAPDHFTFGTPLERSRLEATIQAVPGVRAVEDMRLRRRGWFALRPFTELVYRPGANEVIRVDNEPLLPERGSVRLVMEGGA